MKWQIPLVSVLLITFINIAPGSCTNVSMIIHFSSYQTYAELENRSWNICNTLQIVCGTSKESELLFAKDPALKSDFFIVMTDEVGFNFTADSSNTFEGVKYVSKDKIISLKAQNNEGFLPTKYDYNIKQDVNKLFELEKIWAQNITGKGVKVAILDTGVSDSYNQTNQNNIKQIKDWSSDKNAGIDVDGHGTFVAGLIVNGNSECSGIAPDAELYIYKVFNIAKETRSSWFLAALNQAIMDEVDIINLSIGSTNFTDYPFVSKVKEAVEKGITVVAAAGNDGPYFGSINNPADQMEVLAVGGLNSDGETIPFYSGRGMTTWELSYGMGRVKPDIVTYSHDLNSAGLQNECSSSKNGTSIAAPIVSGSLVLIISAMRQEKYNMSDKVNPAFLRQLLIRSANHLPHASMFEQGSGALDLQKAILELNKDLPKFSIFPKLLKLTDNEPYTFPYSLQPLYGGAIPTIFNLTLINTFHSPAQIEGAKFVPDPSQKDILIFRYSYHKDISAYFGYFSFSVTVKQQNFMPVKLGTTTTVRGKIRISINTSSKIDDDSDTESLDETDIDINIPIIVTPVRSKRILWDQFHNLKYPESNIPRDSLLDFMYPFDYMGDHPYTNFLDLFQTIRKRGYYLEILRGTFTCFNADDYGILIIADPEDMYSENEIKKLENDIMLHELSVIVFADWFDPKLMEINSFVNKATGEKLKLITGGANVPALNTLLKSFGIAFGSTSFIGDFRIGDLQLSYFSGTYITKFPKDGYLFTLKLKNETEKEVELKAFRKLEDKNIPIMGALHTVFGHRTSGKIIVYGDSNVIDSKSFTKDGQTLFLDMLNFVETNTMEIFQQFSTFKLPLDYEFDNHTTIYQDNEINDWIATISKINLDDSSSDLGICHNNPFIGVEYDFSKHEDYSTKNSTLTRWISYQNSHGKNYWILESGLIQAGIMVSSCSCVIFLGYLMRRKRKRPKYTKLRQQNPIILV